MRASILISAILASTAAAQGQDYDDPAIAVCEQELLVQRPPLGTYARLSGKIDGLDVEIRYTDTVLNVRPDERLFSCSFTPKGEKFQMILKFSPGFDVCEDLDEAKIGSCGRALEEEGLIADRRTAVFKRLSNAGVYPIDAANTRLRPQ